MTRSSRLVVGCSAGAAVIVAGSSCGFEPTIGDGAYACAADRTCPPGYVCAADARCYRPGAGPPIVPLDDGGGVAPPVIAGGPFRIAGTVTGLTGKGLVLQDVGTDDLPIGASGPFEFATRLPSGALYNVAVSSQPSEPAQVCTVANGSGRVADKDVSDVGVVCETASFVVGGTVFGLGGRSDLVLVNNGGDELALPANATTFAFAQKIASGLPFDVAVSKQPSSGEPCSVSGGTGTIGVTDVTSIVVNCEAGKYTVGGTLSGLVGTVVLKNPGSSDLTLTSNGSFSFAPLATGATYDVTVKTPPAYPPRAQDCNVTNAFGTVGTANVTNVGITCVTKTFSIGGSVTGLTGTVTLQNNAGDDLTLSANAPFAFAKPIASGDTYSVSVKTQPPDQACTISNASGTAANADVTNVGVACTAISGILCGDLSCSSTSEACCAQGKNGTSSPSCETKGTSCEPRYACDSTADCAGAAGTICCGTVNTAGSLSGTSCLAFASCAAAGPGKYAVLCDPDVATDCQSGGACTVGTFTGPDFVAERYGACK